MTKPGLNSASHAFTGDAPRRDRIRAGARVKIVQKQDQRSGRLTEGIVKDILTRSPTHPHGIKVRLRDGRIGRVQALIEAQDRNPGPIEPFRPERAPGKKESAERLRPDPDR